MKDDYSLPRCRATGKVAFKKREAATVKNYRTKGKPTSRNAEFLRVYHCPHCNYWHLTHHKTYIKHENIY